MFKPMHGNVVRSIRLLKGNMEHVTPIISQRSDFIAEIYQQKMAEMEDGDELYIHVSSKANAPADENTKYFF